MDAHRQRLRWRATRSRLRCTPPCGRADQRYARDATPNLAPDFGEVDEESLRVHATYSAGSASAVELAADPGAELQLTRNAAELPAWVWLTLRDDRGASTLRTLVLGSAAP
jgi:hypothetical protein